MVNPVPAHVFADILVLPHFDVHVVLSGAPKLKLDFVFRMLTDATQKRYLVPKAVGNPDYKWELHFFAPHNDPGKRFQDLPQINPVTGEVTATTPGVYLFQVKLDATNGDRLGSAVGRLQVHDHIVDWWFGNDSITTALDSQTAHSQVSIHARFSDDHAGADVVGDITGHDYFPLTSSNTTKVIVDPRGRLRGMAETTGPVTITGQAPGNKTNTLPVRVVNYAKVRQDLHPLHVRDLTHAVEKSNAVFLAEGFQDTGVDKSLFDRLVTRASADILVEKPRHEPFPLLQNSINSFRAFAASQQQNLTCGFRVTDNNAVFGFSGAPIPYSARPVPGAVGTDFSLSTLIEVVGLPKQGESRTPNQLRDLWTAQSLPGFNRDLVRNDKLIEAWRNQVSDGILQVSDTLFGLYLGSRWADGSSERTAGNAALPVPAADQPAPDLTNFIGRLYDFYKMRPQREMTLDPRRHPPELYAAQNLTNPSTSIVSYLAGLQYAFPPNEPIGQNWVPNDTKATPSRGLVTLVAYDALLGGTNINNGTMIAVTVANADKVRFVNPDPSRPELMRRVAPPPPDALNNNGVANLDHFINKVAHEFGHSFNLGDEYEDSGLNVDPFEATSAQDPEADNLSSIGFLRLSPAPDRRINPDKVKWLTIPRIRVSSRLLFDATPIPGSPQQITVTVDSDDIGKWIEEWKKATPVSLLNLTQSPIRRQLPLPHPLSDPHHLTGLQILHQPDRATGTVILGLPQVFSPPLIFLTGSMLFVPLTDNTGAQLFAVDAKVAAFLHDNAHGHLPLNPNRDLQHATRDVQDPIPIQGFQPPHDSYRVVGIYEGANHWSRGFYRPTGACKMRNQEDPDDARGQFCFVCKWLIANFIDPSQHALLDRQYYPR
jgi:hypothetical protein